MTTRTRILTSALLLAVASTGALAQNQGTTATQPPATIGVTPSTAAEANNKAAQTGATGAVVRTGPSAGEKAREVGNTALDKTREAGSTVADTARDAGSGVADRTRAAGNAMTGGTTDASGTASSNTMGSGTSGASGSSERMPRADRN